MEESKEFLGTGWSFPPHFDKAESGVSLTSGEKDIERSIEIIVTTYPGERVMRPDFGCSLEDMNFEAFNQSIKTLMADRIERALIYYEPRIDLQEVKIDDTLIFEGKVLIEITYLIRSTNSRRNFVFPFYSNEGIN